MEIPKEFKLNFNIENPYEKGSFEKSYVDHFCNGKLLTDISEFTSTRQHFQEFGMYTKSAPNSHPSSQYMKFWKEESRRSIEGYNIGRDWIPGYLYFYWNFTPIWKVVTIEDSGTGRKRGERVWNFPDCWDLDYYRFHYIEEAEKHGLHAASAAKRGCGKSFSAGSMLNRNFFLVRGSKNYVVADQLEFLTKDGILTKTWDHMSWLNENTAWAKRRQYADTTIHKRASYKQTLDTSKVVIEAGYKSEIIGVVTNGDADKLRGKRGKLMVFEEAGANKILRETWIVALSAMQQHSITFGLMYAIGTGGTENADFSGLETLMTNTNTNKISNGLNVYTIPNIFSGNIKERNGFFIPAFLGVDDCYDKNGNSDILKALEYTESVRVGIRSDTKSDTYIRTCAEHPYTIEECMLRMEGSPFDIALTRQVLSDLKTKPFQGEPTEFTKDSTGIVKATFNPDLQPIDNYPLSTKDYNLEGCWVIFDHPKKEDAVDSYGNINKVVTPFRYIAATDPIDFGTEESSSTDATKRSLASTWIIDSFTRNIVAEYSGRPKTAEKYYEKLVLGLEYYNSILLYENNLKGLYAYFMNKNKIYLLATEPNILKDRAGYKSNNRLYGFHSTETIKSWGRSLINTWSLEEVTIDQNLVTGEPLTIPRMWFIKSKPLLQEIEQWTSKRNCDRISSLGACLLLLTDRERAIETVKNKTNERFDDKFFRILERRKSVKMRRYV